MSYPQFKPGDQVYYIGDPNQKCVGPSTVINGTYCNTDSGTISFDMCNSNCATPGGTACVTGDGQAGTVCPMVQAMFVKDCQNPQTTPWDCGSAMNKMKRY